MKSPLQAAASITPSAEEAWSELERESQVRGRVYDDWVASRKLSWADARDRYARINMAGCIVKAVLDLPEMDGATVLAAAAKAYEVLNTGGK